ncbi:MAG: alanine-tRNA synthetase second additional domain-containing protein [Bacteroidales bacterium]|nr:alanine-tRNA synthetase second additional domain-containing protein [Bacteroidales bacterium]
MRNLIQEYMVSSQYFAPRGRERLMFLGEQIAQKHLHYSDSLIGIVGDAGSGKSSLINGMFPGLELSNDDDIINPRKIMQVRDLMQDIPDAATYHLDMRFQMAFTQMYEIVDFVKAVLKMKRRIVIEHFNLLYDALGINADIIVGIGEEIIVTRPTIFGPIPQSIYEIVHTSLKFRKMAHTAEEVVAKVLQNNFGISTDDFYSSDIRNGFILKFQKEPKVDLEELERLSQEMLSLNLEVSYYDEDHIQMGDKVIECDGARFHVNNTSEIEHFSVLKKLIQDPKTKVFNLIGVIDGNLDDLENRNTLYFLKRQ